MKYVIFRSKQPGEKDREIVVYNGQAFYKSTGKNSSHPGRWQPFLFARGTQRIILCSDAYPKIEETSIYDSEYVRGLIEQVDETPADCQFHLLKSCFVLNDSLPSSQKIADPGIALKYFLIISARLNPGYYTDLELKDMGLNREEIKTSKEPFAIEAKPSGVIYDPDQLNKWLNDQGVKYFQTAPYHYDYDRFWKIDLNLSEKVHKQLQARKSDAKSSENLSDLQKELTKLELARRILQDYAKFNLLHLRRKHTRSVDEILEKNHTTAQHLLNDIKKVPYSKGGSLDRRVEFIKLRCHLQA